MKHTKEPLYRKINWRTYKVDRHSFQGKEAKHDRGTKKGISAKMSSKQQGLDYTPLFRFLLSHVGKSWNEIHSEVISRIDSSDIISWMVVDINAPNYHNNGYFMTNNSYYNTLFVDDNGLLQKVKSDLKNEDFYPLCDCCTHTFNGKPLNNKAKHCENFI